MGVHNCSTGERIVSDVSKTYLLWGSREILVQSSNSLTGLQSLNYVPQVWYCDNIEGEDSSTSIGPYFMSPLSPSGRHDNWWGYRTNWTSDLWMKTHHSWHTEIHNMATTHSQSIQLGHLSTIPNEEIPHEPKVGPPRRSRLQGRATRSEVCGNDKSTMVKRNGLHMRRIYQGLAPWATHLHNIME